MSHPPQGNPEQQKVLVVDDCQLLRTVLRMRLADPAIELLEATGGVEALDLVRRTLPDLVLLDINMPDLGGLDVLRQLKSDGQTRNIPVIMVTGTEDLETKVRGFELGAVDYVTKPFEPTELRARVRAALRTKYLLDLLSQRAMIDGLTGLWNRAFFDDRAASEIALARRTGNVLALLMLDIDHFKSVNDRFGHPFGDEVLRGVARALRSRMRVSDVICRVGGEEFAALLPNTDAPRGAMLAEDLRAAIAQLSFQHNRKPVPVTASFGVAELSRDGTAEEMVRQADEALYAAKEAGRNRVRWRCGDPPAGVSTPALLPVPSPATSTSLTPPLTPSENQNAA